METQGLFRAEDYLKEVIKLQLKKPKNWNWELTTSKSSPHLALPIIQLFDSKGKLLVEAKDSGVTTERRSWHSSSNSPQIQRSRSDISKESIDIAQHCNTVPRTQKQKIPRKRSSTRVLDNINEYDEKQHFESILKSKDVTNKNFDNKNKKQKKYTRSQSDDLFKRKLQIEDVTEDFDFRQNLLDAELGYEYEAPKYELRTSSAGTLIVKRYSFTPSTRRRSRRDGSLGRTSSTSSIPQARQECQEYHEYQEYNGCNGYKDIQSLLKSLHSKGSVSSDGSCCKSSEVVFPDGGVVSGGGAREFKDERGRKRRARVRSMERDRDRYPDAGTASTVSIASTASATGGGGGNRDRAATNDEVLQRIRRYRRRIDQLATGTTTANGVHNTSSEDDSDDDDHADNYVEMQRDFDHSFRDYKKRQSKAKVFKDLTKKVPERPCGRDSFTENVIKMGANVSRHSTKGLTGRRSESSGSISKSTKGCPASDTNQQQQLSTCGGLHNYVEASNNNHDYEKLPLNDVDRIPPLGDGAPLHWKFSDNQTVLCDQGYGSERSPEEEFPPPLPEHDNQCNHHLDIHSCYPFITPETTFAVSLAKGSRGLGLSVTGGIDSGGSWPGLIRVKRLFPHQPAATSGALNVGDLILEANGVALTGLTNYEALEVLRTSASQVELRVCRPPPDVLNCVSPISEVPPPPPRREIAPLPLTPDQLVISDDELNGEFEITMRKVGGSLGFTLRKEDDSALGHYIRALVRDPALNDGRIRPGDKIIAVNNVEISSMTHDEAVNFLRKCGQLVKLRLYRDAAQTPIATLSPTETTPRTSFTKKAQLRQEAMDMLNDIAVRKLLPNSDSYKSQSPLASPRRIRSRVMTCPSDASSNSANNPNVTTHYYVPEEQFHEGLLQGGGYLPFDEESFNSLFIQDEEDCDKPPRPLSLELYNPKQTPVACRKPKFNFSLAHNAYELNNLDAEILDAPNLTYNINEDVNSTEVECEDNYPKEPASMPHIPLSENPGFSYKNPAYQSAHPPCGSGGRENGVSTLEHKKSVSTTPGQQSSNTLPREPEKKPRRKKSIIKEPKPQVPEQPEIIAIELNRGWNSRMGFSLQGPVGQTYVSAVYPNSVASKDGRIKEGDRIMRVNDESVEHMTTCSIIDLLRILRGPVSIVMLREPAHYRRTTAPHIVYKDCTSKASNAAN